MKKGYGEREINFKKYFTRKSFVLLRAEDYAVVIVGKFSWVLFSKECLKIIIVSNLFRHLDDLDS